jgi:putative membrane protein
MTQPRFSLKVLSAVVLALGLAGGAAAQSTTSPGGAPGSSAERPASAAPAQKTDRDRTRANADNANVDRGDRKFMENAALGGLAEVQMGKLAQEKAQSAEVKQFGQRMVDDHSKANAELQKIAAAKGVQLPTELDRKHKRDYERLQKLSGAKFDAEYMEHMVSDHKKDVSDFRAAAKNAKDPDLKAFASSTLPTLESHLQMAQNAEKMAKNQNRGGERTATRSGASGNAGGMGGAPAGTTSK